MAFYLCGACSNQLPTMPIVCPECGAENSYARVDAPRGRGPAATRAARARETSAGRMVRLSDVSAADRTRLSTGIAEFDRVAGGGLVTGSLVLIAGEPGIGKSTLLLQLVDSLVAKGRSAAYVSGEESAAQIKLRAERLGLDLAALAVLAETDLDVIAATLRAERPEIAVIDSVQTLSSGNSEGVAGGAAQVKEITVELMRVAKETGSTLLLVGHVTKDSVVAGPKTLEHLVDAVMILEGDRHGFFRVLRATKNRFGATDEIGLFEMRDNGMIGVDNPTPLLIDGGEAFGRVVCPVIEGTRPLLVEVQALVGQAAYSNARRVAIGVTEKRVAMLLAVLERYAAIDLSGHDVYVQLSAGISVNEPAVDAAVCAAIASSFWSTPIDHATAIVGEVRLGGGVGTVRAIGSRAKESARSGITRLIGPASVESPAHPTYAPARDIAGLLDLAGVLKPAGAEPVKPRNKVQDFFAGKRREGRSPEETD